MNQGSRNRNDGVMTPGTLGVESGNPDSLRVAVLVGSTREGRFAETVADWFVARAKRYGGLELDVVDLVGTPLPEVFPAGPDDRVEAFRRRINQADAFVVITPEYNHSYPASLKHAIDLAHAEWSRKPVGFVSYGGISGGLRAVEHLRLVFAELHAATIRDTVSFHRAWSWFNDDGEPENSEGADTAASRMLDQLVWWASALRTARAA